MTRTTASETPELLIVGQRPADDVVRLAAKLGSSAKVVFAGDGAALRSSLVSHDGTTIHRSTVILLDAATHGGRAWELLHDLKTDPQLRRVPVILIGASDSAAERAQAYQCHANSYLPSSEGADATSLLQRIQDFWLAKVRLPAG